MALSTDPIDLLLDDNNDLVVTTDLHFSSGIQGVAQACRIVLQMFQGEWFLDATAGIPYFTGILAKKPTIGIAAARVAFRAALEAVPDVDEILLLDVSFDGPSRVMTIRWQTSTTFGNTPVDEITVLVGGTSG